MVPALPRPTRRAPQDPGPWLRNPVRILDNILDLNGNQDSLVTLGLGGTSKASATSARVAVAAPTWPTVIPAA